MNNKSKLIFAVAIIVIILFCGVIYSIITAPEETNLTITSNSTLYNCESFQVKLSDEEGIRIANKTVNVTLTDSYENPNKLTITTNESGIATFGIMQILEIIL